jgi:hypothetical protein
MLNYAFGAFARLRPRGDSADRKSDAGFRHTELSSKG